jgi:hypothetical protein
MKFRAANPWEMTVGRSWKDDRERIDLAAVATKLMGPAPGRRGERGRKLWWSCPFHEDTNPSLCVEPGKPYWRCYGCDAHGDAANLVMRLEGLTFPEAVRWLTGDGLSPTPGKAPSRSAKSPSPKADPEPSGLPEADALAMVEAAAARLWTDEGAEGLSYLTGPVRCLTPETARAARLGWEPRGVVIPWVNGGRLALVKVRQREGRQPKYLEVFRDPARVLCYPDPGLIRPGRPLIVVEGEFDALCLGQVLGDLAAVATLGSASARPTPSVLGRMLSASPWFVATDGDDAGDKGAAGWPTRARRVRPPGPHKDWSEAAAAGVNLRRWWTDLLAGNPSPGLYTWDDLSTWRWGPALTDPTPAVAT